MTNEELCPYCKQPKKEGSIDGKTVYYCDNRLCVIKFMTDNPFAFPKEWLDNDQ